MCIWFRTTYKNGAKHTAIQQSDLSHIKEKKNQIQATGPAVWT